MKRPTMLGGSKHKRKIDFTLNSSNNNNGDDDDDSVSSHEDDYVSDSSGSSSEEEEETVDAKRIRLAREYLRKMEEKDDDGSEEEDDEKKEEDKLSKRLEEDRLKRMGKWQEPVADRMEELLSSEDGGSKNTVQYLRGPHDLTVTCVALSSNQQYMYSGSKDHSIAMWDTSTQKLHTVIQPCWNKSQKSKNNNTNNNNDDDDDATTRQGGQVLCMDCQDSYLAIGTRDAILSIYNSSTGKRMERFKGHSKAITCLTFLSSNIVMTGSEDRCIRQVSLEQMAHVETLYGHQAAVSSISSAPTGGDDKPMSVGRDRTARVWKLQEESHLIFRGGATMAPADTIAAMNDNKHFLTGHEDGTLAMWNTAKKRPIYTTKTTNNNYPITSLVIHTDLAITGSHDGQLRFWKVISSIIHILLSLTTKCDKSIQPFVFFLFLCLIVGSFGRYYKSNWTNINFGIH